MSARPPITVKRRRRRAEKRQTYTTLYVAVRHPECSALCDTDGKLLAWSDWAEACHAATQVGMIVVNWQGFRERYLPAMRQPPPGARLMIRTARRLRVYHAELDASLDELRTLNVFSNWERVRRPKKVSLRESGAKVRLEREEDGVRGWEGEALQPHEG